jgi:hypothetical protein
LPVSGILLVLTVLFQPDGVAPLMQDNWRAMLAKRTARRSGEAPGALPNVPTERETAGIS